MLVSFPGEGVVLRGFLYRPDGAGAHPAVVWNHGSERDPGALEQLGAFFAASGFVLFAPHRRGHGESPGDYPSDAIRATGGNTATREQVIQMVIDHHEQRLADTAAALGWLADHPFVDGERVAMAGVSHGAVHALLAAEADLGPSAYVPFAPGAMAWRDNPELRDRLLRAVQAASAPIFLLQAANDHDLGPSRVLGAALTRKGRPSAVRIYPSYGSTSQAGHGDFACLGTDVWGDDVLAFLREALGSEPA